LLNVPATSLVPMPLAMTIQTCLSVFLLLEALAVASSASLATSSCNTSSFELEGECSRISLLQLKATLVSRGVATSANLSARQADNANITKMVATSGRPKEPWPKRFSMSLAGQKIFNDLVGTMMKPKAKATQDRNTTKQKAKPKANATQDRNTTKRKANATQDGNTTKPRVVFGFDTSKLTMRTFEPFLVVTLCLSIVGAIVFEMVHYKWAEADLSLELEFGEESKENHLTRLFAGIRPLVAPYFCNPESRSSWNYLGGLIILGLVHLGFTLLWMKCTKEFWDSLQDKKQEEYMRLMKDYIMLTCAWAIVGTYKIYVSMMMIVHWRKFMTALLLKKWFQAKVFYHLQLGVTSGSFLDNPDQRLQEDIASFIELTLNLGRGLVETLGQFIIMLPVLLIVSPSYAFGVFYCPGWLVMLSLLYSGLGTLAAHKIGSHLILINFALQKYEANFRYQIVQVRDHAESIALYAAEDVEQMKIQEKFAWLIRTWWMLMRYTKRLGFFNAFYHRASSVFPYLVLTPNYFKGQITLGDMFVLFAALDYVKGAFDWLIDHYKTLTDYRATVDRLTNFWTAVDGRSKEPSMVEMLENAPGETWQPGAALVAKDVCVNLPGKDAKKLWDKASLNASPGQFILLSAPEGSGKSCFFRALAGIWPHASGSVFVKDHSLFLPQRSFVPQGTLKQAVAYPEKADKYSDEEVRKALEVVKLDALKDRDLSEDANWELALSGGEQQKLAIAHAVLQRPEVLFLDEATSALSEEGTLEVYKLLRQEGTLPDGAAVISTSHNQKLLESCHDVHYAYDPTTLSWTTAGGGYFFS